MKEFSLPKPKALEVIFAEASPARVLFELTLHCHEKERRHQQLTDAEQNFCWISEMGSSVVGDGFVSIYNQFFTPSSFSRVCDALAEAGASKLRELLLEAWSIYTKNKHPITQKELQSIPVIRFNTKKEMDRFDEIGEVVVSVLENQFQMGKVYAVEYAKRHRDEFTPIEKNE